MDNSERLDIKFYVQQTLQNNRENTASGCSFYAFTAEYLIKLLSLVVNSLI